MKNNNSKRPSTLAALTGAALALPAISQLAQADSMPTKTEVGYRYSQYQEDDLNSAAVFVGSNERYEVDAHQFHLLTPVSEDVALTVDALYETMTGASAFGTVEGSDGEPKLIMTGASISDQRTDVVAKLRHYGEQGSKAASVGISTEDDYVAYNGSVELERLSADRITTYSGGVGFSFDELEPVQTPGINRTTNEDRWSVSGFLALARANSPVWQTQVGLYAGYYDGYLSDPYRSRDIRPDQRQQYALTARSRYFLKGVNAALHANYRFYADDWGIESHTVELEWHQSLGDAFSVSPRVRYYSQSQADFYVETDNPTRTGYQSSDYRMSPYGALSYGLGLSYDQPSYKLSAYAESYDSDGDYGLKSVEVESPALVRYTLITLGIDYRF
jgi:hypothetical protein